MKILKPDDLALLYRSFRFGGQPMLSVGIIAMFDLRANAVGLIDEAAMWPIVQGSLGADAALDDGMPKPAGEFMLYGAAYAPHGVPVAALEVAVNLGGHGKRLAVHGERSVDAAGRTGAPAPFATLAISAQHAFGGQGFEANPVGKGYLDPESAPDSRSRALPNVEYIVAPMASPPADDVPAGFWGLAPGAPQRTQYLGAFDEQWLEQTWPDLPDDTRPQFFHVAPPDQRIDGFWTGDEAFTVENMHPERARLAGRLPGLRARCFVNRRVGQALQWTELAARAETVWLFPDQEYGLILYRATTPVSDTELDDVAHLMVAWEQLADAPLPRSHYEQLFGWQAGTGLEQRAPETTEAAEAAGAASVAEIAPMSAMLAAQTEALLARHGPPRSAAPSGSGDAQLTLTREQVLAHHQAGRSLAGRDLSGLDLSHLTLSGIDLRGALLAGTSLRAARLERANLADVLLHQADLSQADLSEANLSGASAAAALFTAARMAGANLSGGDFAGANFAGAQLEGATMTGTTFDGATMTGLKAARCQAGQASFAECDLTDADLGASDLAGARFNNARAPALQLTGAMCKAAEWYGADCTGARFDNADLQGSRADAGTRCDAAVFTGAQLSGANWEGASLAGALLDQVVMDNADFSRVQAAGASFERTSAKGTSFAKANLSGATMNALNLFGGSLRGATLERTMLNEANLFGVDFDGADPGSASLQGANIARTLLALRGVKVQS